MPDELPTPENSDIERVRERVYALMEEMTDSLMMAGEAARDARDWTFTDDQGRRWGISPAGIHLGGITLPVIPHTTNAETAERTAEWNQIKRQADRARVRDRFSERVNAIRERKNQQRGKGGKTGKSGSRSASSELSAVVSTTGADRAEGWSAPWHPSLVAIESRSPENPPSLATRVSGSAATSGHLQLAQLRACPRASSSR